MSPESENTQPEDDEASLISWERENFVPNADQDEIETMWEVVNHFFLFLCWMKIDDEFYYYYFIVIIECFSSRKFVTFLMKQKRNSICLRSPYTKWKECC